MNVLLGVLDIEHFVVTSWWIGSPGPVSGVSDTRLANVPRNHGDYAVMITPELDPERPSISVIHGDEVLIVFAGRAGLSIVAQVNRSVRDWWCPFDEGSIYNW